MNLLIVICVSYLLFIMNETRNSFDIANEVIVISSLCEWFMHCYNTCPVFVIGSIHEALKSAFDSKLVREICFYFYFFHNYTQLIGLLYFSVDRC